MKKTNLIYVIGIGLLVFMPFVRVSVAAPPCWVGVFEEEIYLWEYNNGTAAYSGAWAADDLLGGIYNNFDQLATFGEEMADYGLMPGNMSCEILTVGDLGPDIEYGSNYQSVQVIHALNWSMYGYAFPWDDKVTLTNIYNALIVENATEFAIWHSDLTTFFDAYTWQDTSTWAPTDMDWTEVVTAANPGLAAANATATVVTDGSEEIGFKITVAAGAWYAPYNNSLALGLEVTFADGLLDTWNMTYGTDSMMDVELVQGSSQSRCGGGDIPGFELPIIIGLVSITSLILIKKIRKK